MDQSSVGGPLLWPANEPWPVCRESHARGWGEQLHDIRLRRAILAEAWGRSPVPGTRPGPTDWERKTLASLGRPGRHAPWLEDDDPIPLLPLAQLYCRDVPDLTGPGDFDLLQVFWCPFDAHGESLAPAVHLQWRRASIVTDPLRDQPQLDVVGNDEYLPTPCVLHPEQVTEHQYAGLLPDGLRDRLNAWDEEQEAQENEEEVGYYYQYDLSIAPGWKVGGFASWHLTDPHRVDCHCGQPMELLFTIDSKEWDGGSRSWIPLEDRESADSMDANIPTQVTVGRWGSLRIFTCPANPAHPHQLSEQ